MPTRSSWTGFHDRLHQTLRHRQLVQRQEAILLAVSGGQDSLCLARLMLDLQPKWDWRLAIAHCDHRWRPDSAENAAFVQSLADGWGTEFYRAIAPDFVATNQQEATARQWRYEALTELAQSHGYTCVMTGHTASDRAETLIFNLVRGSGLDGLQALAWQRPLTDWIRLVRPLLTTTRAETAKFCHEMGLFIWEDSSNTDRRYARSRIRHDLVPYLKQHFNADVEQALAQTAELIQAEVDCLESLTEDWWQQSVTFNKTAISDSDLKLKIQRSPLRDAPLAIQRRVLRRCLQHLLPEAPAFSHIEKLTQLLHAPNRSQTDPFPGGAIARVEQDHIIFVQSSAL